MGFAIDINILRTTKNGKFDNILELDIDCIISCLNLTDSVRLITLVSPFFNYIFILSSCVFCRRRKIIIV